MASSSSESSQGSQKYDVFLNFRGEDVRFNFLSYLIAALKDASLKIFVDNELERGEHIRSALMDAIQDSKVALTIFSKGYGSSSWALDELVQIMECRRNPTLDQKVMPVFYHVTPSDVRNQRGVFAEDFAKHESEIERHWKVPDWRAAMKAAGDLSGRIVNATSPEFDVTMQIVNDVLKFLCRKPLEDNPNIQQQQRNGSIWTISRQHGLHVQQDLNTLLRSTSVQVGGEPSESHSRQISEASSSHPSTPISDQDDSNYYSPRSIMVPTSSVTQVELPGTSSSFVSGGGNNTNGSGLGVTMVPYSSVSMSDGYYGYYVDLGNGNWGYGYHVDLRNGYWGYYADLGNGNSGFHVDRGSGNLYAYYDNPGFRSVPRDGLLAQPAHVDQVSAPIFLSKLSIEKGISLSKLGLEMGVSMSQSSLETDISLSKLSLETSVSLDKIRPQDGRFFETN